MIVDMELEGKKYKAIVPDDAPQENWKYGVIVGPPDLSALGLPHEQEVRLHNELHARGLIQLRDVRKNMSSVTGAVMAALRVDAQLIVQAYEEA